MKATVIHNLIGAQVRRERWQRKLTQNDLVSRLHDNGWNISRSRLARIEGGAACLSDFEHFVFAKTLDMKMEDLLPRITASQSVFAILYKWTGGHHKKLVSPDELLTKDAEKLLNGTHFLSGFLNKSKPRRV